MSSKTTSTRKWMIRRWLIWSLRKLPKWLRWITSTIFLSHTVKLCGWIIQSLNYKRSKKKRMNTSTINSITFQKCIKHLPEEGQWAPNPREPSCLRCKRAKASSHPSNSKERTTTKRKKSLAWSKRIYCLIRLRSRHSWPNRCLKRKTWWLRDRWSHRTLTKNRLLQL